MIAQFFQDADDRFSSARLINVAVCVAAIAICFWLTYVDKMAEGYFVALLAYGGGVHSFGKYVEAKRPKEPVQ